jgi:hypothetical protein
MLFGVLVVDYDGQRVLASSQGLLVAVVRACAKPLVLFLAPPLCRWYLLPSLKCNYPLQSGVSVSKSLAFNPRQVKAAIVLSSAALRTTSFLVVLRCAALCCAVLCCAVLCCAVLCNALL